MNRKTIILFAIFLILSSRFSLLSSQESAFIASHQKMALLPGEVSSVSIVDGNLYCYASEVLLLAQRSGEQLLGFLADTSFVKIAEDIEYVVSHPSTGELYFTQRNRNGVSFLYRAQENRRGKLKAKRVRLGGMSVEHPVFTADGNIMIFSSRDRHRSFGGYDLWYTLYRDGHWSRPLNLGNRINTEYDEITPSIYRDCLLFSSNGHDEDHAYLNIYSTRLLSDRVHGDTVGMLQIGRCRVQKLPAPINSPDADDFDMAIDTINNYGYWVSKRVESDSDSQLYSFSGSLDGILLWGRVLDKNDDPQPDVHILASQQGQPVCSATTDSAGFYRLYLQSGQYYDISYRKEGFYVAYDEINTTKADDEFLIAEMQRDIKMDRMLVGQRIYYSDLFGPNVDLQLSDYGRRQLEPLVRFLIDNPNLSVEFSLSNDITTDATFNEILTAHRLQTLQNYLFSMLPPSVDMKFINLCTGASGCAGASGQSRLVVVISE